MDTSQFNGTFWIAIAGSISGFIVILISVINKSKCSLVKCCCFKCVRDTKAEEDIELANMRINKPETSSSLPYPAASV